MYAIVVSLDTLAPQEASALLIRLAGRPGLQPGDVAVGEITRQCGYLPLAIGLMASQLRHHPAHTAESMAASLAAATDRMELMRAENLSVAAAWLEAERANLHAAADYAATRGPSRHAIVIPAAMSGSSLPAATGINPPPFTRVP